MLDVFAQTIMIATRMEAFEKREAEPGVAAPQGWRASAAAAMAAEKNLPGRLTRASNHVD